MYRQIKQIKIKEDADLWNWLGVTNGTVYEVTGIWTTPEGERYCHVTNNNNKVLSVPEMFYTINF